MFLPAMPEIGRASGPRRPRSCGARGRIGAGPSARRDGPTSVSSTVARRRGSRDGPSRTSSDAAARPRRGAHGVRTRGRGRTVTVRGEPTPEAVARDRSDARAGRRRAGGCTASISRGSPRSAPRSTTCGAIALDTLKRTAEAQSPTQQADAVGVKLVDRRRPHRRRRRATCTRCSPTPSCSSTGWRRTAHARPTPGGAITWTHLNGDVVSGALRRSRARPSHRVHLRLGPRRRGSPARIDDRRDRPARHATRAPSCTSCTADSPGRWPTRTPAGGTTTCDVSPPSPTDSTPVPTRSPASEFRPPSARPRMSTDITSGEARFWELAQPLLDKPASPARR